MAIADKAKEHYAKAKSEADHLKKQATKCEVDLQQLLDVRMAQLQATEKNIVATLRPRRTSQSQS